MNLKFGTGGLRATMGPGPDHLNLETIQEATLGVAAYAKEQSESPSAAIAYDSRNHSEEFAREAARVLALKGVKAYIYPKLSPTPTLSFAVRHLKCTVGICVTASHNPREYNGYKVYGSDGCQVTSEAADSIQKAIWAANRAEAADTRTFKDFVESGDIVLIDDKTLKAFLAAIIRKRTKKQLESDLKVVYTPLYGAGLSLVTSILKYIGVKNLQIVTEQAKPNGDFPTCPYPNPEIREAMALGIDYAKKYQADLLLATDPDCDRVGIAVRSREGDYVLLSGNETGMLLLDYICSRRQETGRMPEDPVLVKTIVTIDMAERIAAHYGVRTVNVLTGFKFIGEQIGLLEKDNKAESYIFGFEESYGYLSGSYVRDKDAVDGAFLICEMFAYYRTRGISLLDKLNELYETYGYCLNTLHSFEFEGAAGFEKMQKIMADFRKGVDSFGGKKVVSCLDYSQGLGGLPKSDVLKFLLEDHCSVVVRPSGTEPKLKTYISVSAENSEAAKAGEERIAEELAGYFR